MASHKLLIVMVIFIMLPFEIQAQAQAKKPSAFFQTQTTDRMIIKYKDNTVFDTLSLSQFVNTIQKKATSSIKMKMLRVNTFKANIVKITLNGKRPSIFQLESLAKELSKHKDIEYAEPDYIAKPLLDPNDTYYETKHWSYKLGGSNLGGANLQGAWNETTGSSSDVIAVIDTGILPHSELIDKTLPGYDFISDSTMANDGDGRDNNATDPGDWCYSGDDCYDAYRGNENSSWHGTHVAGTIAAQTNNGEGVSGINWNAKILPVRVLGKGGGYTSDIADGMLWAAGITVAGVPNNPNPAKTLNLSLGGSGPCSNTYQNAIDQINATGATIAIAAGNSNSDVANASPGNCSGIISVAAAAKDGAKAYYSNYGSLVSITAPGGDQSKDGEIYSTLDGGATTALNDNAYAAYQGTSMATPHIAGIASLITSVLPDTNHNKVNYIIQKSARAFPSGTDNDCNTQLCGAGLVDATAAITLAKNSTTDYTAKYNETLYSGTLYSYSFTNASDKIDPNSAWFIDQERLTSNDIDDNETTSYVIQKPNVDMYDINFTYGVSSESGYDGLFFISNKEAKFGVSGEGSSAYAQSKVLTRNNTLDLNWTYLKDTDTSVGNDNAWIDNLYITTYQKSSSLAFSNGITTKVIIIKNNGAESLTISSISLSDAEHFLLQHTCATPVAFDDTCQITVTYTGSFDTPHTTTLSYDTTASNMSHNEKVFTVENVTNTVPIIMYLLD